MKPLSFLRFFTKPRTVAPPKGSIDMYWDAASGAFKVRDAQNTETSIGGAVTQAAIEAAGGALADLSNVDWESSLFDAQGAADYVNSQMYCAARMAAWTAGGGGTAAPLRGLVLGDSLASGFAAGPYMSQAGYIGLSRRNVSGTVTELTGQFGYWTNGLAYEFAVSAAAEFTIGGSATGDLRGDRAMIAYIKRSGGGSFNLEYQANATGAWTSLGTIDTSNATTIGAVSTYNLPTTNTPFYRLRVTGVTTGSVIMLFCGIYQSNGGGVIWMPVCQNSGHDVSQAITTPAAVFNPVWDALAPDFVLTCWADAASNWEAGGAFRTFYAAAAAQQEETDWIVVSANPAADETGRAEQRAAQRAWAIEEGHSWINGQAMFRDFSTALDRGMIEDDDLDVHLSDLGKITRNRHLWSTLPLGQWYLGRSGLALDGSGTSGWVTNGYTNIDGSFLEWGQSISIRNSGGFLGLQDQASLMDGTKQAQIYCNANKVYIKVNGSIPLICDWGSGTAGIYPSLSVGEFLGSSAARWRAFASCSSTAVATKTGAYSLGVDDHTIICTGAGGFTITLPRATPSSFQAGFSSAGQQYVIINKTAGNVTLAAVSDGIGGGTTQKIDAATTLVVASGNTSRIINAGTTASGDYANWVTW